MGRSAARKNDAKNRQHSKMTQARTEIACPIQFFSSLLERLMKTRAESDGDVYLPNPEPTARVDYILIAMEPSLGHWARSAEEARARVASGFRNFLAGIEPM